MKLSHLSYSRGLFCTALLWGKSYAEPLDTALRARGLTLFADFFKEYPPDPALLAHPNVNVFAPTNEAMRIFLSQTDTTVLHESARMLFRRTDSGHNSDAGNTINTGLGMNFINMPLEGDVSKTGQGTTADTKVVEPNSNTTGTPNLSPRHPHDAAAVGRIYSGSGVISNVLDQLLPYDGGFFYITDRFFQPAPTLTDGLSAAGLDYLKPLFARFPDYLNQLQQSESLTLLAPSAESFAKYLTEGTDLSSISDEDLKAFLEYYIIDSGFIGYSPSYQGGRTYKSKSGAMWVVTRKGQDVYINDAKIQGKNHIIQNGVIQILDRVLIPPPAGATTVPGPDGPLQINSSDTAEDELDNPKNGTVSAPPPPTQTSNANVNMQNPHQLQLLWFMVLCAVVATAVGFN